MAKTEAKTASGEDQSMEEILQSIRRIIAEEGEDAEKPAPSEQAGSDVLDVLELTDVVTENGAVVNIRDIPAGSGEIEFEAIPAEPPAQQTTSVADDILKNIDAALTANTPAPEETVLMPEDSLLSPAVAEATSQALKNLKRPHVAVAPPSDSLAFRSGTTVEDLMVEALRPMLKSWLDENLPSMVERIVEREIRKLT